MTVSFMSSKVLHAEGARLDLSGGMGLPIILGATRQLLKVKMFILINHLNLTKIHSLFTKRHWNPNGVFAAVEIFYTMCTLMARSMSVL